jgi:hypothetical protein
MHEDQSDLKNTFKVYPQNTLSLKDTRNLYTMSAKHGVDIPLEPI